MSKRSTKIKINKALGLKEKIAAYTKEYDKIKVELLEELAEEMQNKNLKFKTAITGKGLVTVADKKSYEVTNLAKLRRILGEQAETYCKTVKYTKVESDNKFLEAINIATSGDYTDIDIESVLRKIGIPEKMLKKAANAMKGKYLEDYKTICKYIKPEGDLEEEINLIRLGLNYSKMVKFIDSEILEDPKALKDLENSMIVKPTTQITIRAIKELDTSFGIEE